MRSHVEFIDMCDPYDIERVSELEQSGYMLTGQIGGGDFGSCLIYEDYLNTSDRDKISIMEKNNNQIEECRAFWDWHNSLNK